MNCMKCGREIKEGASFCDSCLEEMKEYPVRPETVVQLPNHSQYTSSRRSIIRRKPQISEQEQIRRLKIRLKRLWTAFGIVLALLIMLCCLSANFLFRSRKPLPGQNYSTVPKTTETSD